MRKKNIVLLLCAAFLAQSVLGEIFRLECSVGEQDSRWKETQADWASQGTFIKAVPGHYSDLALESFRVFLKDRYQDLERLNAAW